MYLSDFSLLYLSPAVNLSRENQNHSNYNFNEIHHGERGTSNLEVEKRSQYHGIQNLLEGSKYSRANTAENLFPHITDADLILQTVADVLKKIPDYFISDRAGLKP